MLYAISQRNMKMDKGNRDALENSYVEYYEKFGITLIPIPNVSKNIDGYFNSLNIKGIVLTGGDDIRPNLYGGSAIDGNYSNERDKTEIKLLKIAVSKKLPVLANCRGAQITNVFFGGKLVQNIKEKNADNHVAISHNISIIDDNACKFFGKKEFIVNSYHNHGIDSESLSKKLVPFAVSDDGFVEGFYHPKYPMAGILWHPEREGSEKGADKKLIKAFLNRKLFWKEK